MSYDPDILIKQPTLHHDIFRLVYEEMKKTIERMYHKSEEAWRSLLEQQ